MKKLATLFAGLLILELAACGSQLTWGDISLSLSTGFCQTVNDCGFPVDVEKCVRHSYNHLCTLDLTCDEEVADSAEDDLNVCLNALSSLKPESDGCFMLGFFGVPPQECAAVWEHQPE